MRKTQTIIGAEVHPAKPSKRRFYVWQIAMWITIVHAVLIGAVFAFKVSSDMQTERSFSPWQFTPRATPSIPVQLAYWSVGKPGMYLLGPFLWPLAVIGSYRASMGKRSRPWLLSYWLAGGLMWLAVWGSTELVDFYDSIAALGSMWSTRPWLSLYQDVIDPFIKCMVALLPLPVTILAALLTLERKKRPPAVEVGT